MATIGQMLGEARRKAGLSIADVAHETHIHGNMLHHIEEDDFSKFASVAYAKSFIRNYAEFLEVDLGEAMVALDSSKTLRLGEHELMGEMKKTIQKDRLFRLKKNPRRRRRLDRPGQAPVFLNVILFSLIAAIVVFYFLGYKASSPEEARSEITKGLQKANPFGAEDSEVATSEVVLPPQAIEEDIVAKEEDSPKEKQPALRRVELSPEGVVKESGDRVNEGAGTTEDSKPQVAPPLSPSEEIEKPEVAWEVGEAAPTPLAGLENGRNAPSPRKTPEIGVEAEASEAPVYEGDLPTGESEEEPVAPLRPAGTTPRSVSDREAESSSEEGAENREESSQPVAARE